MYRIALLTEKNSESATQLKRYKFSKDFSPQRNFRNVLKQKTEAQRNFRNCGGCTLPTSVKYNVTSAHRMSVVVSKFALPGS